MSGPVYSVGILEDNFRMRAHFTRIVERSERLTLCFEAETLAEARQTFAELKSVGSPCDICLVDLQLPDGNGVEFVSELQDTPNTHALILTVLGDKVSVLAALQAGAQGYLLKDSSAAEIEQAVLSVMRGANPISPQAATHLLSLLDSAPTPATSQSVTKPGSLSGDEKPLITERERDVLTMFSRGLSYQETADVLGIRINTVREYTKSIYRKLSVHSRNEAIFEALQQGWISVS